MAVKIIIDSSADILPAEAKSLDIIHVPMTVRFGNTEYRDAIDLTHEEFYKKLEESKTPPTTSQIPPAVWERVFADNISAEDTAVVITISSKLSGTCQSACLAASAYGGRIHVVDTENVCIGEGILAKLACTLRLNGRTAAEIAEILNEKKKYVRLLALVDTMEYLKRGGRVSAAVALAGGVLGIKPVIELKDGAVALAGKARGRAGGCALLARLVSEAGGINTSLPVSLAYSGCDGTLLEKYVADNGETLGNAYGMYTVGCTIGTHAGPGAVAIAFFAGK